MSYANQIDRRVPSACADGAYDTELVYGSIGGVYRGGHVRVLIPPNRNAPVKRNAAAERNRRIR